MTCQCIMLQFLHEHAAALLWHAMGSRAQALAVRFSHLAMARLHPLHSSSLLLQRPCHSVSNMLTQLCAMADSSKSSLSPSHEHAPSSAAPGSNSAAPHVTFVPSHAAINEKAMAGQPAESLAFLLHSLYGMDHYPSYLLKWHPSQLQRLRDSLVQQIAHVDAAAAAVSLRQVQLLSYNPLAPRITRQDVLSWINPLILKAFEAPRDRVLPLLLQAAVDELGDGSVWTFDLLTRDGDL